MHYTDSIFISRRICRDVAIDLAYSDTTCETGCWTLDFLSELQLRWGNKAVEGRTPAAANVDRQAFP